MACHLVGIFTCFDSKLHMVISVYYKKTYAGVGAGVCRFTATAVAYTPDYRIRPNFERYSSLSTHFCDPNWCKLSNYLPSEGTRVPYSVTKTTYSDNLDLHQPIFRCSKLCLPHGLPGGPGQELYGRAAARAARTRGARARGDGSYAS